MKKTIEETTRLLLQGTLTKDEADKILLSLSNVSSSVCPCSELPDGEIAISSKALQKPYGDLGQTDD